MISLTLNGLKKLSANKYYAGMHWTKRKELKDNYKLSIKSQCKRKFAKGKYRTNWYFEFKNKPLDASNCFVMLKMIEDVIFENDEWDLIKIGAVESFKGKEDKVTIKIELLDEIEKSGSTHYSQ